MLKDFLAHLFPRIVVKKNLRVTYTLCLGGLALTVFLLSIFTGILLAVYYIPEPSAAYSSILYIEEHVRGGAYIRSVHKISSNLFVIFIFLHTLRVMLTGAFLSRRYNWVIGMFLMLLAIFEGYTGYLLPMDQLAFWATKTGMELLRSFIFGDEIYSLLAPDGVVGHLTLIRFYILHVLVIPAAIVILTTIHLFRVRRDKGVLPYL